MKAKDYFVQYFDNIDKGLRSIDSEQLQKASSMVRRAHQSSKKIIIVGNGGSAAMASHVTVDLTKTAGIRAINFNEADLLTCFSNDYGYKHWVAKALEFYADKGDLLVLISSSGKSQNIINGANKAKAMGLELVTFSGFSDKNPLRQLGKLNLWVDSTSYNIIEMTHHIWLLGIVDYLIETHNS